MPELTAGHDWIVFGRQTGEGKGRPPATQHHRAASVIYLDFDLGTFWQFANDVVKGVRRGGRAAASLDLRRYPFDDLEIHVSSAKCKRPAPRLAIGAEQHIRENRDRVAPFDHALHVAQGLQKSGPFDREFHACGLVDGANDAGRAEPALPSHRTSAPMDGISSYHIIRRYVSASCSPLVARTQDFALASALECSAQQFDVFG